MLQLSYLYRTRKFITAADLAHAIDGESTQRELEYPIWRNFCGYGVDLIKCRLIKNGQFASNLPVLVVYGSMF